VLGPAVIEDALGGRGLARIDVGHDSDIANVFEHRRRPALTRLLPEREIPASLRGGAALPVSL
jgi:hypothetical protein